MLANMNKLHKKYFGVTFQSCSESFQENLDLYKSRRLDGPAPEVTSKSLRSLPSADLPLVSSGMYSGSSRERRVGNNLVARECQWVVTGCRMVEPDFHLLST